jgi:hypothetical protein
MTKSTKIIAALGVAAGLGIAALPAGAIFADDNVLIPLVLTSNTKQSQDVTVSLTVGEAITLGVQNVKCATTDGAATTGDAVNLTVKATGSCSHRIAGSTNKATGYTLSVKDKDDNTALMLDGGADIAQNKIVSQDGVLGGTDWVAGWNLNGGALENKGITTENQTVKSRATAGEDEFTMTYNFATRADQNAGLYKDVITYTIAQN